MLQPTLGKSFGTRRLQLAGGADLVGRVAGEHLVNGGRVVEQSDRRVAHRADQRDLVVDLGELWQHFGELRTPGSLVSIGLKTLRDVVGNVVLGVPKVEVAGTSLEVEQDNALRLTPSRTTADPLVGRRLLQAKKIGQAEAEHRGAADAQQIAAGNAITGIFSGPSWNHEHGRHLKSWAKVYGRIAG